MRLQHHLRDSVTWNLEKDSVLENLKKVERAEVGESCMKEVRRELNLKQRRGQTGWVKQGTVVQRRCWSEGKELVYPVSCSLAPLVLSR